ncbi:hypothetical protein SY83_11030 [Paenibacillus swuensis]|uniref:VWFA domain-containing protein n=1 Tax=Paenibacillus swuensis TaxID=1178515 RepID=A0A172TID1_9BACL|nr:IPT/TIG domain-containing protein [Paenibacillus swuensis]ANE46716.1 hypothetical protein SY83_11030 [Paenibacillus swuensis]
MRTTGKWFNVFLCFLFVLSTLSFSQQTEAAADYVNVNKSVNPTQITTEGEAEVTLQIQGTPPVNVIMPSDVILIIDRSGSMRGQKMSDAIKSAKEFVDLVDLTKHQVGIVDFSSDTKALPLTTDAVQLKSYINGLAANGSTATGDSIDKAMEMLANHRPEAQPVIVLMTDGDATVPTVNPYQYAKDKALLAKEAGIVFYTIALLDTNADPTTSGPNILLKEMATTSSHHHFVLGSVGLSDIYKAIVREIGMASAYNIVVSDLVAPEFEIVPDSYKDNIPQPTVVGNQLQWNFLELKNSLLTFKYKIRPKDKNKAGTYYTSDLTSKLEYNDYAGAKRMKFLPAVQLSVKFPAPVITSVEANEGAPEGGNTITLNGTNFRQGATVTFGGTRATSEQFVSSTEVKVVVPQGAQGSVEIKLTNPDNQIALSNYKYKATPVVTSIDPATGPFKGENLVAINGKYFMPGAKVTLGDKSAAIVLVHPSVIKVTAPQAAAAGPVNVTVENPDGSKVVVANGYTYEEEIIEKLEITAVSPNKGLVSGGDYVVIDGKKFVPSTKVYFGTTAVSVGTFFSETKIRVTAPAATTAGLVDITVENTDGRRAVLVGGYTYEPLPAAPAPQITRITPNTGESTGGTTVIVDGANFTTQSKVFFGSVEGVSVTYFSPTRLRAYAPAGTVGAVDIKVVNKDLQEAVVTGGYTYVAPAMAPAPTVTSLTPNSAPLNGGTIVLVYGTNFVSGAKVYYGSTQAQVNNVISTRITSVLPQTAAPGQVNVRVVNPDGQEFILTNGFTYTELLPTITATTPNKGPLEGGTFVIIDGTNFDRNIRVNFNGVNVPVTYFSDTRIRVTSPSSVVAGPVTFTLTNPTGSQVSGTFTYENPVLPSPVITRLNSTSGPLSGGSFLIIDGSNYTTSSKVYMNGVLVPNTFFSVNRLRITVPASATPGTVDIYVENADGQRSNVVTYTYL